MIFMTLSERDKKLLCILLMILIAFAFYNFGYKPLLEKYEKVKSENTSLHSNLDEINRRISIYSSIKNKLTEIETDYDKVSSILPSNQDEKFCIIDLINLANTYGIQINDISFSQKQKFEISDKPNLTDVYYFSTRQTWLLTYANFKKLLYNQKDYKPLYSLESISISNAQGKTTLSCDIRFYGFEDELAKKRDWFNFNIPRGKGDIFTGGFSPKTSFNLDINPQDLIENKNNQLASNPNNMSKTQPSQNWQTAKANTVDDFSISVSTVNSPTTNVSMQRFKGVIIFGANKEREEVNLFLQGKSGSYKYKMQTQASIYPQNNFEAFVPNQSDINISIYSNPRKYQTDKNTVVVNIHNQTDKKVNVYIINDDKANPRVFIKKDGNGINVYNQ